MVGALEWRKTLDAHETGAMAGSISQACAFLNDEAERLAAPWPVGLCAAAPCC